MNTEGNLVCNQKSIYCNSNNKNSKCQKNDIQYGIDNRLDSALNTLLDYLNTNSNQMKQNCIHVVKKYIYEWGLENHLEKYYNLFTRIALDDPSERARNYFSSNALLISLMMNIVKNEKNKNNKTRENQLIKENIIGNNNEIIQYTSQNINNFKEIQKKKYPSEEYINGEESINPMEEENRYPEEENRYQEEENRYQEEENRYPEEENRYPGEEGSKYPGSENIYPEEEKNRFDQETKIIKNCKNSNYGCCPDGTTAKYDVQGSNCVNYPKQIQPYSPQDNNYVLNSSQNQRITYLTDPQNPTEIPDTGPFNRTLYLYNENPPVSEEKCPKCPDMSKYIRKDQIPCWGCNLE